MSDLERLAQRVAELERELARLKGMEYAAELIYSNHTATSSNVTLSTDWTDALWLDVTVPTGTEASVVAQAHLLMFCNSYTSATPVFGRILIDGVLAQTFHGEWNRVWERVVVPISARRVVDAGKRRVKVQVRKGSTNAGGYLVAGDSHLTVTAFS